MAKKSSSGAKPSTSTSSSTRTPKSTSTAAVGAPANANANANASGNANRTPARSNYAAPHTPIASAKRPRASMDKNIGNGNSNSNGNGNGSNSLMSPGGASGKGKVSLPPSTPLIAEDGEEQEPQPQPQLEAELEPGTPKTPQTPHATLDRSALSPMHPPRPLVIKEDPHEDQEEDSGSWVGRQVGTLFSPMLNLLSHEDDAEHGHGHGHGHAHEGEGEHKQDADADADADLAKPTQDSTSLATAQETVSHDEEEDDDDDDNESEDEEEAPQDDVLVEDDGSSQGSLDEDEFNPYVFIKSLPAYRDVAPLRPPIALPPKKKDAPPISLVLDLDETLVHCTVEPVDDADLVFPVVFHGMTYQVHVRLRPHLFTFLEKIKGKYEVIVFTASQQVYADELLNLIDPDGKFIQYRMFRESCLAVEGNFLKDLNVLGRDLTKSVLVDNSPHAFGYQVDNGIPIESWFDDPNDTELLKLERFLRTLHGAEDVRSVVRKAFKTYQLIEEA